jgi:PhnB protein
MENLNIPEGYQQVMPYLLVKGAAKFITFTEDVFGAREKMRHMRDEHIIAHAEITIGDNVIMFADATDAFAPRNGGFFIYVADADETYDRAIAAGSTSIMHMSHQPYGRSGGVTDPFGNQWWITTNTANPQTPNP